MKKRFKIFFFLILFFLPAKYSFSENLIPVNEIKACSNFYEAIKNDEQDFLKGLWPTIKYKDFGFYIKQIWDTKNEKWIVEKNNEGNLKVGEIYSQQAFSQLKTEDSIIKINDKKILEVDEFNQIYDDEIKEIKIELKNKEGENYTIFLKKESSNFSYLKYSLVNLDITEIDLKRAFYETSIDQSFQYLYTTADNTSELDHEYLILAKKYIMGKLTEDSEGNYFHICDPTEEDMFDNEINNPLDVTILNVIRDDNDLEKKVFKITPFAKPINQYDALRIEARTKNVQRIKNYFNLKSFPFDKQLLQYKIVNNNYSFDARQLDVQQFVYETLDNFMKRDDIPGWSKEKYSVEKFFYRDSVDPKNFARDGVLINIEIERKHGYYIFKVIIPIALILIVCWSVVWINPKELEAKLTITIVCLLSLIAYNFVIDEELPKLEYLTVMDWIVLTSYVYATIPNFLSIYSFRNRANLSITNKVDNLSKKFGISSYVLIIFLIVFLNANLNPDNSSTLISWMAGR